MIAPCFMRTSMSDHRDRRVRQLGWMLLATVAALSVAIPPGALAEPAPRVCRALPADEVEGWLQGKNRLVFFASWCGSCLTHLKESRGQPRTGLVLVFDDLPKGSRVLATLALDSDCVTSPDLVRRFGVTALPFATDLDKGSNKKAIR